MLNLQNDKNAIYSIADAVLQAVFQTDQYCDMQTDDQEETGKYYCELCDKLKATLNNEQKELFDTISDVSCDIETTAIEKGILYGMRVQESFRAMIDNPVEVFNYYASKGKPVRELYKVKEH